MGGEVWCQRLTSLPAQPSPHTAHIPDTDPCVSNVTLLNRVASHRKRYYRWRHSIKVQAASGQKLR